MASKMVSLREIPVITQLYASGALKAATTAAKPPSAAINAKVGILQADITKMQVDAVVNAANTALRGGGGVDGAIHRAAGPELLAECRQVGGCPVGESRITQGYKLPASHIIHTVGPVYRQKSRDEPLLRSCYKESLDLAAKHGLKSIAFSGISTGVYGYPSRDAARVACEAVRTFLEQNENSSLGKVVFVTFDPKDIDAYDELIPYVFPPQYSPLPTTQSLTLQTILSARQRSVDNLLYM